MSRSFVKRGLAWAITATPPITTKSTPPATSRRSRRLGRNSGQLATCTCSRAREVARLPVHRLQALDPLCGRQLELLADEALVDRWRSGLGLETQPTPHGMQRVLDRSHGRIRIVG